MEAAKDVQQLAGTAQMRATTTINCSGRDEELPDGQNGRVNAIKSVKFAHRKLKNLRLLFRATSALPGLKGIVA